MSAPQATPSEVVAMAAVVTKLHVSAALDEAERAVRACLSELHRVRQSYERELSAPDPFQALQRVTGVTG